MLAAPALATPSKNKGHAAPAGKAAAVKGKAAPVRGARAVAPAAGASPSPAPRIVQREPALVPRLTSAAPEDLRQIAVDAFNGLAGVYGLEPHSYDQIVALSK